MMGETMTIGNLSSLANLLKPQGSQSDSEDEEPKTHMSKLGPGDVGPKKKSASAKITMGSTEKTKANSKDIWEEDEVPDGAQYDDIHDERPSPDYDIVYSQAVRAEDMFLQTTMKTAATASCENMIVKIKLPNTDIKDVKLDVKPQFLDCRCTAFRLGLHLPHPVDSKNGKAEWNSKEEILSVTLKMQRDYDFLNF